MCKKHGHHGLAPQSTDVRGRGDAAEYTTFPQVNPVRALEEFLCPPVFISVKGGFLGLRALGQVGIAGGRDEGSVTRT